MSQTRHSGNGNLHIYHAIQNETFVRHISYCARKLMPDLFFPAFSYLRLLKLYPKQRFTRPFNSTLILDSGLPNTITDYFLAEGLDIRTA